MGEFQYLAGAVAALAGGRREVLRDVSAQTAPGGHGAVGALSADIPRAEEPV